MTFTRTTNGLQNYPAFFKCDLMVYTEGKTEVKIHLMKSITKH